MTQLTLRAFDMMRQVMAGIDAKSKESGDEEYRLAIAASKEPNKFNTVVELLMSAGNKGNGAAIYRLGRLGSGVCGRYNGDPHHNAEIFVRAAALGHRLALAECWRMGYGIYTPRSDAKAMHWVRSAVNDSPNDPAALELLAEYQESSDPKEALENRLRAADLGSEAAQLALGEYVLTLI